MVCVSKKLTQSIAACAAPVAAATVATLVVATATAALGRSPGAVLSGLVVGPLGNPYRFAEALTRAIPLMLCGLAVAIAFRCQAWNIGVEGQYLAGAIGATAIGVQAHEWPGWLPVPVMLAVAAVAGAAWAWPAGVLEHRRRVPLVLSTILLNFVAMHLVRFLTRGPMQGPDPAAPESPLIAAQGYLRPLVAGTDFHAGFVVALAAAAALWVLLARSTAGFAIRAAGLNPTAAQWAGIRVPRVRMGVLCLSGALGGLAGGLQIAGVHRLLRDDAAEGFGYVGIAVALLGRLSPAGVAVAAVALGMLDVGAMYLERQPALGIPSDLAQMIKGTLILTLLASGGVNLGRLFRRRTEVPETPTS